MTDLIGHTPSRAVIVRAYVAEARLARVKARNFAAIGHRDLAARWRRYAERLMADARKVRG